MEKTKYIIECSDDVQMISQIGTHDGESFMITGCKETYETADKLEEDAYQRGYEDGCATSFKPVSDTEYQRGANDAWECAKKLIWYTSFEQLKEMGFDVTAWGFDQSEVLRKSTALGAISKLNKYEEKNHVHEKDIVRSIRDDGTPIDGLDAWIVTEVKNGAAFGFDITGLKHSCPLNHVRKICKYDNSIDELFKEIVTEKGSE